MPTIIQTEAPSPESKAAASFKHGAWLLLITLLGFGIYYASALAFGGTGGNEFAYFDKLGLSFLQGRLHIITTGPFLDLTQVDDKWYVPFPPLPALLFMPWLKIFGLLWVDAILFSIVLGTANVFAAFGMLQALSRHGYSQLTRGDNMWLTLLFTLGTVHWYMTLQGSVWFLAQLATFTFMALAVWAGASTRSGFWPGLMLGTAMLARPHVALMVPLLVAMAWVKFRPNPHPQKALTRWLILCALPMLFAVVTLLAYNQARFDNPLDFGYTTAEISEDLTEQFAEYGQFHPHYLQRNLRAFLWATPVQDAETGSWAPDLWGMSIFLTTPAFLALLLAIKRSWLALGAWTAVGLILIPLLLYYNTGWWQFGYRFTLDFMAPLLVLLVLAAGTKLSLSFRLLIVLSVGVNAWGTVWFMGQIGRTLQAWPF